MTKEHFVSKCLARDNQSVMAIKGLEFCQADYRQIRWSKAYANILCQAHNNALSPADQEAKRFQELAERIAHVPDPTTQPGLYKGPEDATLRGLRFARWIAKTYCNQLAMDHRDIPLTLIEFAFLQQSDPKVRIYFASELDVPFESRPGFFEFMELVGQADEPTLLANFCGYRWILSTLKLDLPEEPTEIDFQGGLPDGSKVTALKLSINWWPD